MCIAIAKMRGVDLPSKETFETCFANNDDGCGFSYAYRGKVYIQKGFMKFEDFYKTLTETDKEVNLKELGCLFHFRIATHGATDETMTHPFPIIADEGALKKTRYVSDYSIVHNGIISLTSTDATKNSGLSDTAIFVRDYLTKIAHNKNWLRKRCNIELIEKLIDSKMAILDKWGNIKLTSGFTCDNGVYYSNTSYKDTYKSYWTSYYKKYSKSKVSSPYYYDDDYYNYYSGSDVDTATTMIPLMKLTKDMQVCWNDEYLEQVPNEEEWYCDDGKNIFWRESVPLNKGEQMQLYLVGQCDEIVDLKGKTIDFKEETSIDIDNIEWYNDSPTEYLSALSKTDTFTK